MEKIAKIATHPLYIRVKKVMTSCETFAQLKVAIKYYDLAIPKIAEDVEKYRRLNGIR